MTLEEKLAKLEDLTEKLKAQDVTLSDSFKLYQEGMDLIRQCNADIDKVEKQVQILNAEGEAKDWETDTERQGGENREAEGI